MVLVTFRKSSNRLDSFSVNVEDIGQNRLDSFSGHKIVSLPLSYLVSVFLCLCWAL